MKLMRTKIERILAARNAVAETKKLPCWSENSYYGRASISVAVADDGGLEIRSCCGKRDISKGLAVSLANFLSDLYL